MSRPDKHNPVSCFRVECAYRLTCLLDKQFTSFRMKNTIDSSGQGKANGNGANSARNRGRNSLADAGQGRKLDSSVEPVAKRRRVTDMGIRNGRSPERNGTRINSILFTQSFISEASVSPKNPFKLPQVDLSKEDGVPTSSKATRQSSRRSVDSVICIDDSSTDDPTPSSTTRAPTSPGSTLHVVQDGPATRRLKERYARMPEEFTKDTSMDLSDDETDRKVSDSGELSMGELGGLKYPPSEPKPSSLRPSTVSVELVARKSSNGPAQQPPVAGPSRSRDTNELPRPVNRLISPSKGNGNQVKNPRDMLHLDLNTVQRNSKVGGMKGKATNLPKVG